MLLGTIVNTAAIVFGSVLGMIIHIRDEIRTTIMQGLGLVVIVIGMKMGLDHDNILIPLASLVVGGFIGESLKLEAKLSALGEWLARGHGPGESKRITQGFVTASLVYCVGAMAVIGSLESGLQGTHDTLFAKAMLDGVSAVFFASSFGVGVMFSAVPVLLYQGLITVFASLLEPLFHAGALQALGATGGMLIAGIGINILGLAKISVGNLLPSLVVVVLLSLFF
jgi:uncharacterized membrane protein YqgA involved in biofilm formation